MQETPLNKDYIIQSLTNQNANLTLGNAEKDSIIRTQYEQIQELEKKVEQLHEDKIAELDKEANEVKKGGDVTDKSKSK